MRLVHVGALVRRRRKLLLDLAASAVPSYANSTFTAASATGTADGSTTNALTLTLRDTNAALMAGRAVTFTTELTAVDAGESALMDDAAEIAATTGILNLILVCRNAAGVALPNIQPARIVFASTGSNNTFGTPTMTDANGQSLCTFTSTTAEAKTISVTVDGVAVTQTAAVTVTGDAPMPALTKYSKFDTVGTDEADRSDGDKWNIFNGNYPGVQTIDATGLGFPTPNVLEVSEHITPALDKGLRMSGLDVPDVGDTIYDRLYLRISSAAAVAVTDPETHPYQDGSAASQLNFGFFIYHATGGAGEWTFQWRPSASANAFPNQRWECTLKLAHDAALRFEQALTRTDSGFTVALRIYNSAGVLLATEANFRNQTSSTDLETFCSTNAFAFFNVAHLDSRNAGSNGLGGSEGSPAGFVYSYQAAFAWGINCGWIGAYNASNEP